MARRLKRGEHVRSTSYEGVALWFVEWCKFHGPECAVVMMVGDDVKHHVHPDTITPLDPEDFCSGCGQIGCGWG